MTAPSEFPARAESFVDVLPEAPRLPQAAGLGVAHGSLDRVQIPIVPSYPVRLWIFRPG
jgi:hypothetical protein